MHPSMSLGANFNDRNFDMEIFMVLCFIDFKLCGIISLFFTYLQRSLLSGGRRIEKVLCKNKQTLKGCLIYINFEEEDNYVCNSK